MSRQSSSSRHGAPDGRPRMPALAIIGAGRIGSRHLQGLTRLSVPASVFVVEPSEGSVQSARERLAETDGGKLRISWLRSVDALPRELDLAIVATRSDVREQVVRRLLEGRRTRGLILEKVLFQDPGAYGRVGRLLEDCETRAWVNCARRLWSHVRRLRERLAGSRWFEFSVGGTNWGMASNAVHFLDLAAFLVGRADFRITSEFLDAEPVASKRSGFLEFNGTLAAALPGFGALTLNCRPGDSQHFEIRLHTDKVRGVIHELEGRAWFAEKTDGWRWREESYPCHLLNEKAHLPIEQFLKTGDCELTPFGESAAIHASLIGAFMSHLERARRRPVEICPIT